MLNLFCKRSTSTCFLILVIVLFVSGCKYSSPTTTLSKDDTFQVVSQTNDNVIVKIPPKRIAVGAFFGYFFKITNGYERYCNSKGYDIKSYINAISQFESDLFKQSNLYLIEHPNTGLKIALSENEQLAYDVATQDLSQIKNACNKLQKMQVDLNVISFRSQQPQLAKIILSD